MSIKGSVSLAGDKPSIKPKPPQTGVPAVGVQQSPVPDESRSYRDLLRKLGRPVLFALGIIFVLFLAVLGYYYFQFSQMVDARLRGDFFDRSSSIYSAPLRLRAGQAIKQDELISYLQPLGYAAGNSDSSHGRFIVRGETIEIYSSSTFTVRTGNDSLRFPRVLVKFNANKAIQTLPISTRESGWKIAFLNLD